MQINNDSPWAAQLAPAWGKNHKQQMTLVIKTGFRWDDEGRLFPLEQDDIPLEVAERFYDDDAENASLAASNDLVPFKEGFELLLSGTAYPPNDQATEMTLSVALTKTDSEDAKKDWEKAVRVFGKRRWKRTFFGTLPSLPEPIEPTPVRYEYAFGGKKFDNDGNEKVKKGRYLKNPAGLGFAANETEHLLPLIECPPLISRPHHQPEPAGFGPLASVWQPRRQDFESLDNDAAAKGRTPYPASFNPKLFNSAPTDQQFTKAPGAGTWLELVGWHAQQRQQRILLPETEPTVMVYSNEEWQPVDVTWDTLIIDADKQQLFQLWRGAKEFNPARIELMQFHVADSKHEKWKQEQAHLAEQTQEPS